MNKEYQNLIIPEDELSGYIDDLGSMLYDQANIVINESNIKTYDFNKDKYYFNIYFDNYFNVVKKEDDFIYIQQMIEYDHCYICDKILKTNIKNVRWEKEDDINDDEIEIISLKLEDNIVITDEDNKEIKYIYDDEDDVIKYPCYWTKGIFYVDELNLRIIKVIDEIYNNQKDKIMKFNNDDWNKIGFALGYSDNMLYLSQFLNNDDTFDRLRLMTIEIVKYIYDNVSSEEVKIFMYEYMMYYIVQIKEWYEFRLYFISKELNEETEKYVVEWFKCILTTKGYDLCGESRYDIIYSLFKHNRNLLTKEARAIIDKLL